MGRENPPRPVAFGSSAVGSRRLAAGSLAASLPGLGQDPMTLVSVVLCSYDGTSTLPQTLREMSILVIDGFAVEFILVDNASQDDTMEILRRAELPGATRVLAEPRPGKSHALNTGVAAASGELVVFTDDDVLPAAGWLAAFHRAARHHPDVVAFAGQVRPEWQAPPPRWLEALADMGRAFGATPLTLNEKIQPVRFSAFKGANMMIRRSALADMPFDTGGGNFGPGSIGGEDTGLVKQLLDAGHQALFVPDALVRHLVRPEQIGLRPLWQREVRIGRTMAAGPDFPHQKFEPWLFGHSVRGWRRAAKLAKRAARHAVCGDSASAARVVTDLARLRGQLRQSSMQRKPR